MSYTPVRQENQEKIVELYKKETTLWNICKELGWTYRALPKVTQVLRNKGYNIPFFHSIRKNTEHLHLTKSKIEKMIEKQNP